MIIIALCKKLQLHVFTKKYMYFIYWLSVRFLLVINKIYFKKSFIINAVAFLQCNILNKNRLKNSNKDKLVKHSLMLIFIK